MQPPNPHAFPSVEERHRSSLLHHEGMTLRDYFAGQAIIGLLSFGLGKPLDVVTSAAFEVADAMLAERNK